MAINKVIDRNNNTLIDLTYDTVAPNKVLSGVTFHKADGTVATGMLEKSDIDMLKYKFFDYDGTLLYSYTDEELDALTELPNPPDHTSENLTFQRWNWNLEDLKAWNRERVDRPHIGAHYITADRKTYFYLDIPFSGMNFQIYGNNKAEINSIDWGDGTIDTTFSSTTISHTYSNPGEYIIIIDNTTNFYWYIGYSTGTTARSFVKQIRLGNYKQNNENYCFYNFYGLIDMNVPDNLKINMYSFNKCINLKYIVVPDCNTSIPYMAFDNCQKLSNISLPNSINKIDSGSFNTAGITTIILPDTLTSILENAFSNSRLENINIPDSVTAISSHAFEYSRFLKRIILGNNISNIGSNAFYSSGLEEINFPDSLENIGSSSFSACSRLRNVKIPDSVTSIGAYAFQECYNLRVDLSSQTKLLTLSNSLYFNTAYGLVILVPESLLDQYKSASYWSNYADYMVGV